MPLLIGMDEAGYGPEPRAARHQYNRLAGLRRRTDLQPVGRCSQISLGSPLPT